MNNNGNANGAAVKKTTTTNGSAADVSSFSTITTTLETTTKEQLENEIKELKEMLKFAESSVAQMQSLVEFFERQNRELREENARLRKQVHGQYEPIASPQDLQSMGQHPLTVTTNSETLDEEDFDQQLKLAMRLSLEENQAALPATSSSSSSSSSTTVTSLRPAGTTTDSEGSPSFQR